MQVIIPMAGYGKRLRPHTFSRPKPMLKVAGQPMLQLLLDSLQSIDIDEYIMIVGYLGEQIEEYVRANVKTKATFVTQHELIGQSHAVHLAQEHLSGPCLLVFADTLFEADLGAAIRTDADGVAFVKQIDDPRRFGVVELDKMDRVTRFVEKPTSMDNKNVVIGLYYLKESQRMLQAIEKQMEAARMLKGEYFLTDAFQLMVDDGADFRTAPVRTWLDCGKPETMLETNRYLLEHGHDNSAAVSAPGVAIIPPVNVAPTARLARSVIGPHAVIGANCTVEDSIIRDSIVDDGARVTGALLEHSLVGCQAVLAGRFQAVNVTDESSITLT